VLHADHPLHIQPHHFRAPRGVISIREHHLLPCRGGPDSRSVNPAQARTNHGSRLPSLVHEAEAHHDVPIFATDQVAQRCRPGAA